MILDVLAVSKSKKGTNVIKNDWLMWYTCLISDIVDVRVEQCEDWLKTKVENCDNVSGRYHQGSSNQVTEISSSSSSSLSPRGVFSLHGLLAIYRVVDLKVHTQILLSVVISAPGGSLLLVSGRCPAPPGLRDNFHPWTYGTQIVLIQSMFAFRRKIGNIFALVYSSI